MQPADGTAISFAEFEVDLSRQELRRAGAVVKVEPQVLDLIAYLAAHPGEVLSRDDLIENVWDGRIVSDSAIASRINAARAALGDDGKTQRIIRTISRRGYRFEAPQAAAATATPPRPDKPSIAVLPFQNMSGDPDQRYFSDGIADDIMTELSRYDELFVIARHSSFAYRDSPLSTAEIAAELGVQYIAEGSVRRAGNRVRVTVQLIEPTKGSQIWAERYDRELDDIFAVQDEITSQIVNTLAGKIARQHWQRMPASAGAYEYVLMATEHALRSDPVSIVTAREALMKALDLDPKFARAHAILALTCVTEGNNFWSGDTVGVLRKGYNAARTAVGLDPRDPWAHAMLGASELWHNRAHDRALASMQRSVELNPANAQFRGLYSYVLAFCGRAEEALVEIDRAFTMSPHFPPVFLGFRGRALFMLRRIEEALPVLAQMVTQMPGHSNALAYAAAAYAASDRTDDARRTIGALGRTNPNYTLSEARRFMPYADTRDLEFVLDLFARAGMPEGAG